MASQPADKEVENCVLLRKTFVPLIGLVIKQYQSDPGTSSGKKYAVSFLLANFSEKTEISTLQFKMGLIVNKLCRMTIQGRRSRAYRG